MSDTYTDIQSESWCVRIRERQRRAKIKRISWNGGFVTRKETDTGVVHRSLILTVFQTWWELLIASKFDHALTAILLTEIKHLVSFIKWLDEWVPEESCVHHSIYHAQPIDLMILPDSTLCGYRTLKFACTELFLDTFKEVHHESRLTYTAGVEEQKII